MDGTSGISATLDNPSPTKEGESGHFSPDRQIRQISVPTYVSSVSRNKTKLPNLITDYLANQSQSWIISCHPDPYIEEKMVLIKNRQVMRKVERVGLNHVQSPTHHIPKEFSASCRSSTYLATNPRLNPFY